MALASRDRVDGHVLGARFEDVHVLRRGSRFTLYGAREVPAGRLVAVKVPDEPGNPWLADVLTHEASVLAAISSHPHIITLYQRFQLHDGRPALLLEHCPESLSDELHAGSQVALQSVVSIGIKLAGALETVHRAGFVHCDVRPDTTLVSTWGEPILAGFDECVHPDDPAGTALHVTTPHTAPELLEGRAATPATDVYGLASTLYELVAGRAAFRAYAGESPATVIVRVLSGQVKPIVGPGIPLDMSDLLTWAMNPDPSGRPPTPAWLAEELGRIEHREGWPRTRMITA